jgi:hypothetical protein
MLRYANVPVGEPIKLSNMAANHVVECFRTALESAGIEATLTCWTDPPQANPDAPCKWVYVMRCDGMTDEQIQFVKKQTVQPEAMDVFVLSPLEWNSRLPPSERTPRRRHRSTKKAWETMQVGENRLVRMHRRDLVTFLTQAMVKRELPWTFRCERMPFLETDKMTVWQVKRLT